MKEIMVISHKKIIRILFISMIFPLIFSGCMSSQKTDENRSGDFDIKIAANVTESYMNALVKGDESNIKQFCSSKLLKSPIISENEDLKIFGYNIAESNEVGSAGLFKIKVSRSDINKVFASLDQYDVRTSKEGNEYKVVETNDLTEKEAFRRGNSIRMRNKNNAATNLVLNAQGLPGYTFSKDDAANIDKLAVPKNFSLINFSYGGDSLAVSTYDKNSFIGIIKIDESLAVQSSSNTGGSDNGGNGQGSGGEDTQSQDQTGAKEKPIGREIVALDILRNSKVELMSFSPTEKFIAVQYSASNGNKGLRVYKIDGGDIIPFKFEDKYPIDKVDVIFSSYDKENLNFDVVPKSSGDKSVTDYVGKWQLNLKSFKENKM